MRRTLRSTRFGIGEARDPRRDIPRAIEPAQLAAADRRPIWPDAPQGPTPGHRRRCGWPILWRSERDRLRKLIEWSEVFGTRFCIQRLLIMSRTTPTIRSHGQSGQIRKRWFSALSPGQNFRAMVRLITATGSTPERSASVSMRPSSKVIPIAGKYPDVTNRMFASFSKPGPAGGLPSMVNVEEPPEFMYGIHEVKPASTTPGNARTRSSTCE